MRQSSGSTGAGPLFREVMLAAMRGRAPRAFAGPGRRLERVPICPVSGALRGPHCPHRHVEVFLPSSIPSTTCDYHRELVLDRRNGLLAGPGCPEELTRRQRYLVYPPEYAEWAKAQGLARPPTERSPLCGSSSVGARRLGASQRRVRPKLLSPSPGGRYLIDPSFGRRYQALPLKAEIPEAAKEVVWVVDGEPYATVTWPFGARWSLEEGEHTFQVVADGRASELAQITVR